MGEQDGYREALQRLSKKLHADDQKRGGSKTFEQVRRETAKRVTGFEKRHPNRPAVKE